MITGPLIRRLSCSFEVYMAASRNIDHRSPPSSVFPIMGSESAAGDPPSDTTVSRSNQCGTSLTAFLFHAGTRTVIELVPSILHWHASRLFTCRPGASSTRSSSSSSLSLT